MCLDAPAAARMEAGPGWSMCMECQFGEFLISDDKGLLQPDRVDELMHATYWAAERSSEVTQRAIENSLCVGVYRDGTQIAFARCVTDYATLFWLADVAVDERFRGQGVGKAMVEAILGHESLRGVRGLLATRDAHGLYSRFGFVQVEPDKYMRRDAKPPEKPEQADSE